MGPGDVVGGRFELLEHLGDGGMGVVYRALDRRANAMVAIKVVEDAPQHAVERFAREARMLASLSHPHIVRHVAHGSAGVGAVFLAMELLQGESLLARLERGTLGVGDTLVLGKHVAEALAAAHARGVVHRDVKPSNLFLQHGEVARITLLDFGVARMGGARSLTRPGQPMGTPMYMAPEQAKGGVAHGPPVDVYALGAVMFECLTGRPAFMASSLVAVLAKVLFEPAPRLCEHRHDAPIALELLIDRMMSKRPEDRFADGQAAAEAIAALLSHEPRRLSSAPPPRRSLYPEVDRRRILSVVLVADSQQHGPVSSRSPGELRSWRALASAVALRAGGYSELLAEGTPVVVLPGEGDPAHVAERALEAARELKNDLGEVTIGISTVVSGTERARTLVGAAIDAASVMLAQTAAPGRIYLDAATASALEDRVRIGVAGPELYVLMEG